MEIGSLLLSDIIYASARASSVQGCFLVKKLTLGHMCLMEKIDVENRVNSSRSSRKTVVYNFLSIQIQSSFSQQTPKHLTFAHAAAPLISSLSRYKSWGIKKSWTTPDVEGRLFTARRPSLLLRQLALLVGQGQQQCIEDTVWSTK